MLEARTVDEVWALHIDKMAEYGFDRLLYAYTRISAGGKLGDAANALMLSNHPKEYLDRFIGDELYRDAPMVRWTNENHGVCNWRCLDDMQKTGTLTEAERRVLAFNRAHGVVAGCSISFRDLAVRVRGGIGLVARPGMTNADVDTIWTEHGDEILTLNRVVHLKIISLPHPQALTALTARQREALEWVAEGKTTQDIAILMGVSMATVEKHLRLAREALAVESTAQAIAKASMMNQIFVLD
ncbi:LuxR family transcriptional regulator [Acidimangrovimonas pyrenivorans]|uniref:LuxR family transcriptional regulator n=1 Tax=Acidimangrovimonas pyrenivorans TaxID=2030798 RepID=A0ABV7ADS9_9RHOB